MSLDHGWSNPAASVRLDQRFEGRLVSRWTRWCAKRATSRPFPRSSWTASSSASRTPCPALAQALGVEPAEMAVVQRDGGAEYGAAGGAAARGRRDRVLGHDFLPCSMRWSSGRPATASSSGWCALPFLRRIGPRTRLVLLTHPSNLTGLVNGRVFTKSQPHQVLADAERATSEGARAHLPEPRGLTWPPEL